MDLIHSRGQAERDEQQELDNAVMKGGEDAAKKIMKRLPPKEQAMFQGVMRSKAGQAMLQGVAQEVQREGLTEQRGGRGGRGSGSGRGGGGGRGNRGGGGGGSERRNPDRGRGPPKYRTLNQAKNGRDLKEQKHAVQFSVVLSPTKELTARCSRKSIPNSSFVPFSETLKPSNKSFEIPTC